MKLVGSVEGHWGTASLYADGTWSVVVAGSPAPAVAQVKKIGAHCKAHPDICIARDHPLLAELDAELEALAGEVAAQLEALRR